MMSAKRAYLFGAALCALVTAGSGTPAFAEGAETTATEIEAIIVTARKREETLQDLPGSVIATREDAIRDLRITDVQVLSQHVPSFTQAIATPNPRYYLRGVGSGSNASFEQAVGTFVDGIYRGRGVMGRLPYFDLQSIDVQLGPQVVLYGNSATGGAINVVTKKPTADFGAEVQAGYEFKNRQTTLQGSLNLPLSDTVRIRLAAYADDMNRGWLTTSRPSLNPPNVTHDPRVHDRAARLSVQFLPTEDLDILLRYEVADIKHVGGTLQIVANPRGYPFVEGDFDLDRESGTPGFPSALREDLVYLESQTLAGEVKYQVAGGTLASTTGYLEFDYDADQDPDQTRLPVLQFGQFEEYWQFSQELRFSSSLGEKIDYIVGAYYQKSSWDRVVRTDVNVASLAPFAAFNPAFAGFAPFPRFARRHYLFQDQTDKSIFADVTFHVTDALTLELGARYTEVRKKGDQGARAANYGTLTLNPAFETPLPPLPPVGIPPIPGTDHSFYSLAFNVPHDLLDLRLKEEHFMPEAIVRYEFGDDSMVYAKAVRGAKAGGFDDNYSGDARTFTALRTGPSSVTYEAETATAFEVGLRSQGFDRRLQYGVTLYHIEVEDLQVGIFNGGTNFVVGNADTRSRGVEGYFTFRPIETLTFNGVASYTDAEFTKFLGAGCTFAQTQVTPTGCTQDLTGAPAPVPEVMFNLGVVHEVTIGDYTLSSRLQWNHRGSYNFSDANEPLLARGAVDLVDANISLAPADGDWEVSVFAKNILDERWSVVGAATPLISGTVFSDTQRPFQIGVQFRARFGR